LSSWIWRLRTKLKADEDGERIRDGEGNGASFEAFRGLVEGEEAEIVVLEDPFYRVGVVILQADGHEKPLERRRDGVELEEHERSAVELARRG